MWKSTSFASVSQYMMKRVDAWVASFVPRLVSSARTSARLAGDCATYAAPIMPASSASTRSAPAKRFGGYFSSSAARIAANASAY
jgi:hypothetical protein